MPSLVLQPLDRRSDQRLGRDQTRATQPPSLSAIMTPLETCQSMPSHFPQSPSTPPHSVTRSPSPTHPMQQGALTAKHIDFLCKHLLLRPGQHPVMHSMTAPRTGCYPMATAPPPCMPTARGQSVSSMLSPSPVTPCYRSTRTRSLCEYRKPGQTEKRLLSLIVCSDQCGT